METAYYTFSPVTATDRAGVAWVAAILSLMFTILTLATRFQIKAHTLGRDDWLIAAATIFGLGQYIAVYVGLDKGVGRSSTLLTQSYARELGEAVLASEILFILSIMLSKLSVVYFMKRLFTRDHSLAWWACHVGIVITTIWGLASALAVSVGCGPSRILYGPERCPGKLLRWELVISFDAALEVSYVLLAVAMVYPLQMKMWIKSTVVFAFAFRLVCAILAALHGTWIAKYVRSSDPGLAIADVLVWQQVCLGYSLIATTIPTLKNFVRGYNHAMGWDPSSEKRGLGGGYNLASLVRSGNRTAQGNSSGHSKNGGSGNRGNNSHGSQARRELEDGQVQFGPRNGDYRVGAFHDSDGKGKRRSGASDEDLIRRDVSVTVEHERASGAVSRTNSQPSDEYIAAS
ncbi:hypothetical protein HII31_05692 [Pseudocercospora fuligena]|uniref:Rhodopsin domain-containing protein n=1 Tax=Pseudocercospora fuligena TaxID=685502 RepID=A0A8H6RI77_9PEZI|nr:hypothetical protein HII31_05692 [Pseudocercospora fuligena]